MWITFRLELVKCGKSQCKGCPHGPYWYGYWHVKKRTHKRYFGKELPQDLLKDEYIRRSIARQEFVFEAKQQEIAAAFQPRPRRKRK